MNEFIKKQLEKKSKWYFAPNKAIYQILEDHNIAIVCDNCNVEMEWGHDFGSRFDDRLYCPKCESINDATLHFARLLSKK
jgi:ssDNA-binding Zn-finger/Zn-ribbon topoisomerase 1